MMEGNFHDCENQNFSMHLKFSYKYLFALFLFKDNPHYEYVGMYIPLESEAPSAEEFKITLKFKSPQEAYNLEMSAPCIERCHVTDIFKSHKIVYCAKAKNQFICEWNPGRVDIEKVSNEWRLLN